MKTRIHLYPKSLAEKGVGGKAGGKKHARTGAYYLWPRVLCSYSLSMRGVKRQKYFEKEDSDGEDGKRETYRRGPRTAAAAIFCLSFSLLFCS